MHANKSFFEHKQRKQINVHANNIEKQKSSKRYCDIQKKKTFELQYLQISCSYNNFFNFAQPPLLHQCMNKYTKTQRIQNEHKGTKKSKKLEQKKNTKIHSCNEYQFWRSN